jgi:hypothetical protein
MCWLSFGSVSSSAVVLSGSPLCQQHQQHQSAAEGWQAAVTAAWRRRHWRRRLEALPQGAALEALPQGAALDVLHQEVQMVC